MPLRTSRDSPLGIAELRLGPGEACLGLTICPGKKDRSRQWDRDLGEDLDGVRDWGATTVVTLIEDHELRLLAVEDLGAEVERRGMDWMHLPIRDVDVPDDRFERISRRGCRGRRSSEDRNVRSLAGPHGRSALRKRRRARPP